MSNISGSVDVVRERERQARLQLLDEYRDPSPQPVFSQPIKVELEDETSRRIKDTLGDFTQVQHVLINDPKHLIGISRPNNPAAAGAAMAVPSTSSRHSHGSSTATDHSVGLTWSRNVSGSSHPNHHSSNRSVPGNATAKRPVPVNGLHKPPTNAFESASTSRRPHHQVGETKKANQHSGPSKHHRVDPSASKGNSVPNSVHHLPPDHDKGQHREKDHRKSKSGPSPAASGPATSTPPPPVLQNGALPNGVARKRFNDPNSKKTQAKSAIPKLNIPPQVEKNDLSHFEVESILKEMKQVVPPPLTAIQTPRTEERGFPFPYEIKKEVKSSLREAVAFDHSSVPSPAQDLPPRLSSPVKRSPSAVVSPFNLQEDLEMSDTDDEANMVPSCKNPELSELAQCPKSPENDDVKSCRMAAVSEKAEDGHSSSSESSDSESEDTCSNDSDESASSSDASELEAPAKQPQAWGLSNFFSDAVRNHSPAFVAVDTNTNSSNTAIKEEPLECANPRKDGYTSGDDDCDRDIKEYLSPMNDLFMMDNGPISLKSEVLSPIPSPLTSPVPPPVIPRGPRTPPSPPDEDDFIPPPHIKVEVEETRVPKGKKQQSNKCSPIRTEKVRAEDRHARPGRKIKKESPAPKGVVCREAGSEDSSTRTTHRVPVKSQHKHASSKRDTKPPPVKTKSSKHAEQHHAKDASRSSGSKGKSAENAAEAIKGDNAEKAKHRRSREQRKSSAHRTKSSKSGSSKGRSKSDSDAKRQPDKKKKSSKFSIKNFLQSPSAEVYPKERSLSPVKNSPLSMDSRDASPRRVADDDDSAEDNIPEKRRKSSSSRSRSRSGSRSSKHRENVKCRTSSGVKKSSVRSTDSKKIHKEPTKTSLESISSEHQSGEYSKALTFPGSSLPDLLSPIPCIKIESAIPPVMVSIPLVKLLRIPGQHSLKTVKVTTEDHSSQKEVPESLPVPCSDRTMPTSLSPAAKKDFKAKHRTDSTKTLSVSASEKSSKSLKPESVVPKSVSPSANDKSSIEPGDRGSKSTRGSDGQKKRKLDKTETDHSKKKQKISATQASPKTSDVSLLKLKESKMPVVKIERMDKLDVYSNVEKRPTPKHSERRDSTSSLSSLCSQQSHKSSKGTKEKAKESQESKKPKVPKLLTAKEIKKEKEDKPAKVSCKKEPGLTAKTEKIKSRTKDKVPNKALLNETKKIPAVSPNIGINVSSQINYWDGMCKIEDTKAQAANHQQIPIVDQDMGSDWERFAPDIQQELKGLPNHLNKVNVPGPMSYYFTEGKKLKYLAAKETDPIQQALKYFEATVMFVLTSLHRELSNKDPDSIYQMYKETLKFTHVIRSCIQKHQSHSMPGNIDFRILILCLKCQSLLHLKLYSLKIKEVKEQHKGVSDFMHSSCSRMVSSPQSAAGSASRSLSQPSPCQPRMGGPCSVPSPHSPTPSPAGSVASVGSQSSGYSSSELNNGKAHNSLQLPHMVPHTVVSVPQNMFDVMARHHTHLSNLHMCHELWEQADMYMTRSNSKDFFREVAEKSEKLSLHSNIKDLISYLQTGLSLLKDC